MKFAPPSLTNIRKASKVGRTVYQKMNLDLAVVTDDYISKKQANLNVAGAIYKTNENGTLTERPIRGGINTNFAQELTNMVGILVKDIGNAAIEEASHSMVDVLKRAVVYAPFWFNKPPRLRPSIEGMHLRGSGKAYVGNTVIASVLNGNWDVSVPPSDADVSVDNVAISTLLGKKRSRKLAYTVEFNRLKQTGSYAGFDLATWIHEELSRKYDVGGPKYLERALNEVQPYERMQRAMIKLVGSYKYPRNRKSMVRDLCINSINKIGA